MFGIARCDIGLMNKYLEYNSFVITGVPVLTFFKTYGFHLHGRRVVDHSSTSKIDSHALNYMVSHPATL
jgi:hypothetical protein